MLVGLNIYYWYPYEPIPEGVKIDKLVVDKSAYTLTAYAGEEVIKKFTISLGASPIGPKERDGDEKTPEGEYTIDAKADLGQSGFHRNLGVSYPEEKDIANARSKGYETGGDIKIHGLQNGMGYVGRFHRWWNWTDGCIALTDEEIDDLYKHVKKGTPIIIKP